MDKIDMVSRTDFVKPRPLPPESMYFNELVLAIAYSNERNMVIGEVKRSFNDGKINMVEANALFAILGKINEGDK